VTTAEQDDVAAADIVAGEQVTETLVIVAGLVVTVMVELADFVVSAIKTAVSVTAGGDGTVVGAV
jgi:hypothetical protein